jgi:hypothetical protein
MRIIGLEMPCFIRIVGKNKLNKIIVNCLLKMRLSWLWVGVFLDRESRKPHLFLKHKATPKLLFYSPQGEASRSYTPGSEGYLTKEQIEEEEQYIEFIEKHDGYWSPPKLLCFQIKGKKS